MLLTAWCRRLLPVDDVAGVLSQGAKGRFLGKPVETPARMPPRSANILVRITTQTVKPVLMSRLGRTGLFLTAG